MVKRPNCRFARSRASPECGDPFQFRVLERLSCHGETAVESRPRAVRWRAATEKVPLGSCIALMHPSASIAFQMPVASPAQGRPLGRFR
jgi:hypothetical protein